MTPDETKIQKKKIRLMWLALILGGVFALKVLSYLKQIAENTKL